MASERSGRDVSTDASLDVYSLVTGKAILQIPTHEGVGDTVLRILYGTHQIQQYISILNLYTSLLGLGPGPVCTASTTTLVVQ